MALAIDVMRLGLQLVYLREHATLAKIAAGFGTSESTAHAYTTAIIDLLAERAPGLLKVLRGSGLSLVGPSIMWPMKDLEGIGAVASAGVAAVGIVATLLLGRWALRGAQDAAHAGQAQAAATYQAALDAVQAQSQSDHQQWRRGIQREAYAAFLQSVLSYTDGARDDLRRASGMEETRACVAALRALETDMSQRAWVVRLEGPDEVSSAAMTLQTSAKISVIIEENHARRMAAMTDLNLRNRTHPQEVTRIWELIPVAQSSWRSIGTPEDTSTAALAELRDLFTACELSPGLISTLCEPHEPASGDHPSFDEASCAFIRAAREALHSEGLPAV